MGAQQSAVGRASFRSTTASPASSFRGKLPSDQPSVSTGNPLSNTSQQERASVGKTIRPSKDEQGKTMVTQGPGVQVALEDRYLEDLREQKQQRKINKQKAKAQKQQPRHLQQQHSTPYQQQSPSSTRSTLESSFSSSGWQYLSNESNGSAEGRSSRGMAEATKDPCRSLSGSSSSSTTIPARVSTPAFLTGSASGDPDGRSLSSTATSAKTMPQTPYSGSTSTSSTSVYLPVSEPPVRSSKFSFIYGKPGFAWLEKRLTPSASSIQSDLLNSMEIEASKGYVDRVTEQHYLMKDVMNGNYHVPMDLTFKRVLENGCGAGDWTLDMASEMAETDFVACPQIVYTSQGVSAQRPRGLLGADQSQLRSEAPSSVAAATAPAGIHATPNPTQPMNSTIRPTIHPRNCYFFPDVPENHIPFPKESFDFVYQRRQSVVLLAKEWLHTLLELQRVLKPGGWLEILEPDLYLRGGGDLCKMAGEYCIKMFEAMGRNPNVIHELEKMLKDLGFVNVSIKVWSIPMGWGGAIGEAMLTNQKLFVNELEASYVRQGLGDSADYRTLTKNLFDEAVALKSYVNYYVVVGQKPELETNPVESSLPGQSENDDDEEEESPVLDLEAQQQRLLAQQQQWQAKADQMLSQSPASLEARKQAACADN
ncbi:hypothetical protein BGW38_003491 [Lunasporangiospora selenospora]|uniref:Methyltransferase domain-containing protein n=1 Tax=Lunasporangiospora selenospora TaxID=979761 RepID=A0A9P6FRF0_9FUNG|nr:hypothetical protein BGW38_003491 [Lunasporangiospora selenospora]